MEGIMVGNLDNLLKSLFGLAVFNRCVLPKYVGMCKEIKSVGFRSIKLKRFCYKIWFVGLSFSYMA